MLLIDVACSSFQKHTYGDQPLCVEIKYNAMQADIGWSRKNSFKRTKGCNSGGNNVKGSYCSSNSMSVCLAVFQGGEKECLVYVGAVCCEGPLCLSMIKVGVLLDVTGCTPKCPTELMACVRNFCLIK